MAAMSSRRAEPEPAERRSVAIDDAAPSDRQSILSRHGLLIGCLGIFAGVIAVRLPREIGQDTWLSLLVGRRIAHEGIPHHDIFTAWTLGQSWVDQQWLAHLLSFGIYPAGGMVLLSLAQVVLLSVAVAGALAFRRRA